MKTSTRKKMVGGILAAAFSVGLATPALAEGDTTPPHEPVKCNSGRGNNSETTPESDCDPGNSGANNNGGD